MRTENINGFVGLNTTDDPTRIKQSELVKCENTRVLSDGTLKRKPGMKRFKGLDAVDSSQIDGIYMFKDREGVKHYFCVTDGSIWKLNESIPQWEEVTQPDIKLTKVMRVNFLTWKNNCYFANGENIYVYNTNRVETQMSMLVIKNRGYEFKDLNNMGSLPPPYSVSETLLSLGEIYYMTNDDKYIYCTLKHNSTNQNMMCILDIYTLDVINAKQVSSISAPLNVTDQYLIEGTKQYDKFSLEYLGDYFNSDVETILNSLIPGYTYTSIAYRTSQHIEDNTMYMFCSVGFENSGIKKYGAVLFKFNTASLSPIDSTLLYESAWWYGAGTVYPSVYGFCIDHGTNTVYVQWMAYGGTGVPSVDPSVIYSAEIGISTLSIWDTSCGAIDQMDFWLETLFVRKRDGTEDTKNIRYLEMKYIKNGAPIIWHDYTTGGYIGSYQIGIYHKKTLGDFYKNLFLLPPPIIGCRYSTHFGPHFQTYFWYAVQSGDTLFLSELKKFPSYFPFNQQRLIKIKVDKDSIPHDIDRLYIGWYDETTGEYKIINDNVEGDSIEITENYYYPPIIHIYILNKDNAVSSKKRYPEVHQNHLFFVDTKEKSLLEWSDAYMDNIFSGHEPVAEDDGDDITGIKSFQSRLIIFKRNNIYALDGVVDNHFITKIKTRHGCVSNETVKVIVNEIIFLSEKGFCLIYGNNVKLISDKKIKSFFRYGQENSIDIEYIYKSYAVIDDQNNEYKCYVPLNDSTECNYCIIFNYNNNTWYTEDKEIEVTALANIDNENDLPQLLIGTKDSSIFQDNAENTHDGEDIRYEIITKKLDMHNPIKQKFFRKLIVNSRQFFELAGAYRIDDKDWIPFLLQQRADQDYQSNIVRIFNGRGKTMQIKFIGKDSKTPFEINGIEIHYKFLKSTGRGR